MQAEKIEKINEVKQMLTSGSSLEVEKAFDLIPHLELQDPRQLDYKMVKSTTGFFLCFERGYFDTLGRIEHLNLSRGRYQELPKNMEIMENLKALFIYDNPRLIFPKACETLSKLKSLKTLSISNCKISEIPLALLINQIETIPPFIFQMKNLVHLSLRMNPIKNKDEILREAKKYDLFIGTV